MKTSLGSCPVATLLVWSDHWLPDPGWLAGAHPPLLPGPLPLAVFPNLFPVEDQAVADLFLKGETLMQVEAATNELQPQQEVVQLQLSGGCLYLVMVSPLWNWSATLGPSPEGGWGRGRGPGRRG